MLIKRESTAIAGTPLSPSCDDTPVLLTESERHRLLVEWNDTATEYPREQCIHQLFEAQAQRTPEAVALVFEGERMTYRELNERANQLAHHLGNLGVKPETLVGLHVERSLELVVGILGILKAGGAYVPMDPVYPPERLAHMVEDARAPVVVTQKSLAVKVTSANSKLVCLDSDWPEISGRPTTNPRCPVQPDQLAYVIYTSGSTGKPKGSLITHYNVVRLFQATQDWFHFDQTDVWTLFHSSAFDFSVWEIWGALLYGGRLIVVSFTASREPELFYRILHEHRVTVLNQTPSAFRQLIYVDEKTRLGTNYLSSGLELRLVIFGGESLDFKTLKTWFDLHGDQHPRLVNMYGITETTVHVTYRPIEATDLSSGSVIGRPIPDLQVYLLNEQQQLVPMGVPGEIYVGGAGVGRGYLNRPDLTASKFIANPFHSRPDQRLYRSGDLGRFLPNGDLEYLGRIDQQVKIRGFRIELGEVESVLSGHPVVRECVVAVRENSAGEKDLTAYLVIRAETAPTILELREFMQIRLPDYMVPTAFVILEKLPLTANGKVDRQALAVLKSRQLELGMQYIAPRTHTDEVLASIWGEVLGVERVGIHDNFFDLGGHSLLVVRAGFRIGKEFNLELSSELILKHPTIAELGGVIDAMVKGVKERDQVCPKRIARSATNGGVQFPVSFNQQQLWYIDHMEPGRSMYNVPLALRIQGSLNPAVLRQSLNHVIQRHESLRTTFVVEKGILLQVVAPKLVLELPIHDLRHLAECERETEAQRLMQLAAGQPFDLSTGPLVRAELLCLDQEKHILLVTIHHIVFDGWSVDVWLRELAVGYSALNAGQTPVMPELPVQYADYAVWQRENLTAERVESHLAWWREQLAGAPTVLELPTDRPRETVTCNLEAEHHFILSSTTTVALRQLGRQQNATMFATLMAVFHVLLHRYSRQDQILIGTPFAGRSSGELEPLIGFFVNTLPVKGDLADNPTFTELLRQVRDQVWSVQAHQDLPFEMLVQGLQPERKSNRNPFFQVVMVYVIEPTEPCQISGLNVEIRELYPSEAKFDLTLMVTEHKETLDCLLRFNTSLFDNQTIARMAGSYKALVENITANPEQPVAQYNILTEYERHRLLVEWNATAAGYPCEQCIHQLFEAQAATTPEAVAVICGDKCLTYQDLNRRANQLAYHLRIEGVKAEVLVGVCLERSLDMVVTLMAILKAGGAFVPLDPVYPKGRLSMMLQESRAPVLITQSSLLTLCNELKKNMTGEDAGSACKVICFGGLEADLAAREINNPKVSLNSRQLAYVIFTSGSTGQPKGVMIEHRSVVNHLLWRQRMFPVDQTDGFLQKANLNFDISIWEIFTPLLFGARLVLARPDGQKDPAYLVQLIRQHQITMAHFGPALLQVVVEQPEFSNCTSLRRVFCGGEPLSGALQKSFFDHSQAELISQYGPTETTVDVTWCRCGRADIRIKAPIGRPIDNTQCYVLDSCLQPVPLGVAGELFVGGDGLARGYLNRPELTKEKFIANPFSDEPGARLYRTGDLCRYLPNGDIEFLGRLDNQVKLRGFRIELGEIEAVLVAHSQILNAVVVARENVPGNKQLVAYLVAREGVAPKITELRAYLLKQLPDYMVPESFVSLPAFPLTLNGKIDRKALPAPEESRLGQGGQFVAPVTVTEQALAKIWSDLLGVDRIGIHDNFFALGGHSLLAVRMVFRIREALKVELPVRRVTELPTIAELGRDVDELVRKAGRLDVAARPVRLPRPGPGLCASFPASFNQQQLWFIDQLEPGNSVYNIPLVVRLKGQLNREALRQSLNQLVCRHEILRTTFQSESGEPIQVVAPELAIELPTVELGNQSEEKREAEVKLLMQEESEWPFNLKAGPLLRARLLALATEEHVLLLTIHHIVFDGWSEDVLWRELAADYAAICNGQTPDRMEPPIQYADYAVWQRENLTAERMENQLAWWREELAGVPTVLDLPVDRPREAIESNAGAGQHFKLSAGTTCVLRELGRQNDATLFVTLLTAFHVLLHRYSRQDQILIGMPFAGRMGREVEDLVGFFVNTLPVKADFEENPSFAELLRQVRDMVWSVQAHQELPFEKLVEDLQPVRDQNLNPIFQVCAIHEVVSRESCSLPGLMVERLESALPRAKFDLMLSVKERGDELECVLHFNAGLFDDSTVARLADSFQTLLAAVVADPQQKVSLLPLLGDSERKRVLVEWNDTAADYPRAATVQKLFEAHAERTPEAEAVIFEEQRLTYRELNERANQLAHRLRALGVGVETLVGVHVDRSIEYVVCVLGILKAGGAYVPLDTGYPPQRIQFMLADSGVKVVVSDQPLSGEVDLAGISLVDLIAEAQLIRAGSSENLELINTAEHPAYVIYTSGSTGQPKGVVVPHRGVVRLVQRQNYAEFNSLQRFMLLASTSFDATTFELWGALLNGAVCVIYPKQLQSFEQLETVVRQHGVTCLWLTAGLFNQIIDVRPTVLKTVQHVLTGGEALSVPHVKKAMELLPSLRLSNGYGPTESTTFACCHTIKREETFLSGSVPIGRPIANTQCYVLDSCMQPVPVGVAGELYIGGDGLALGYLNRPELTAEKFIANPFSDESGARLYRTGDLCRYLADGNIEFLGRLDNQVKIRGFRIELGEIEAALAAHPQMLNAAVIVRENAPGDKQLVAFLVTRKEPAPMVAELRTYLLKQLPDYMVPAAFVTLEELPLTPNGKIDRKALSARRDVFLANPALETSGQPHTPLELQILLIWQRILNVNLIGIHDNFFDLGGHSLLAVRLISEINKSLNLNLSIPVFFRNPTVEGIARVVERENHGKREPRLIPLQPGASDRSLFFLDTSMGQCRLTQLLEPGTACFATIVPLPEAVIRATARNDKSGLPSLEELAAPHVALIQKHQPDGACLLVGHSFGGLLAFEVAHQLQRQGREVELIFLLDSWAIRPIWWRKLKLLTLSRLWSSVQFRVEYWWFRICRKMSGMGDHLHFPSIKHNSSDSSSDVANKPIGDVPWEVWEPIVYHAWKNYQLRSIECRAVLFRAQHSEMARYYSIAANLGWDGLLTRGLEVVDTPGDHFTLLKEPNLQVLADQINQRLKKLPRND